MSGPIAELRGALDRVQAQLGEAQSALSTARDRNDAARMSLGIAMETSGRDEASTALASCAAADELAEQAIGKLLLAVEQIEIITSGL